MIGTKIIHPDVRGIKHFGKCWYSFSNIPKSIKREQFQQMIRSRLARKLTSWGKFVFVFRYLLRLRKMHSCAKEYAKARESKNKRIINDYAGITAGYATSLDVFGQKRGYSLFSEMFHSIGHKEMSWLWPACERFYLLDDPFDAIKAYWTAYLDAADSLSLVDYEIVVDNQDNFQTDVTYCAYNDLFFALGYPELSYLNCEVEFCAMKTSMSSANLVLTRASTLAKGASRCTFTWRMIEDNVGNNV